MTQEEKAKAYDEALEKAKIEINTKGIGETVNLCYQLFPELAETNVFPPKQEWSEEDEKDVAHIIRVLDDCYAYGKHDLSKTDHENLVNKLKSLRPTHWKPSEEQMKALCSKLPVVKGRGDKVQDILETLYYDLKKLM